MTSKHTPGPWTARYAPGYDRWIVDAQDSRGLIPVANIIRQDDDEDWANARLIEAAPDMLEALRELVAEADEHPGWEGHQFKNTAGFNMAREAIAKAEGK